MKTFLYALQFKGAAAPDATGVPKVKATAQGGTVRTVVGNEAGAIFEPGSGAVAEFESDVTMMGDNANESGVIRLGELGSLRFSTVGRGTVDPSPIDGISAGAVIWKVDSGDGKLTGASGLITSNFFFNAANEVTDTHFGVLYVP